jgi:hypothetical protein
MNNHELETPTVRLIHEAIETGDGDRAKKLLDLMAGDWERNKDYSINWITSLLSFIGRRMGEEAVEEALRDFGERFLAGRREGYWSLDARKRMEGIVRGMKANFGEAALREDDEKYVLEFRCGSGGKLIDEGAYAPPRDYLTLRKRGPVTFDRDELPVYCAHCSVNNEIVPVEADGAPVTVQFPPSAPGERCVHHIYKDAADIPDSVYRRIGKQPPAHS